MLRWPTHVVPLTADGRPGGKRKPLRANHGDGVNSRSGLREQGPSQTAPSRVIIENVRPEIDCGQFPIKRTVGEEVVVEADIFAEGHDNLMAIVKHRPLGSSEWAEAPMTAAAL